MTRQTDSSLLQNETTTPSIAKEKRHFTSLSGNPQLEDLGTNLLKRGKVVVEQQFFTDVNGHLSHGKAELSFQKEKNPRSAKKRIPSTLFDYYRRDNSFAKISNVGNDIEQPVFGGAIDTSCLSKDEADDSATRTQQNKNKNKNTIPAAAEKKGLTKCEPLDLRHKLAREMNVVILLLLRELA